MFEADNHIKMLTAIERDFWISSDTPFKCELLLHARIVGSKVEEAAEKLEIYKIMNEKTFREFSTFYLQILTVLEFS